MKSSASVGSSSANKRYKYHKNKILKSIKDVLPSTTKTVVWILKITIAISLLIVFLKYFGILAWFSKVITPVFNYIGLPGEAALAYVSGYLVNVYAAISVILSFDLDARALTIFSVMALCSHNMITETAVQKKTGTSAIRIVIVRTLSAFVLAFILNKILPGSTSSLVVGANIDNKSLVEMLKDWFPSTALLALKIAVIIYSLAIMQKLMAEYGVIRWISKFLKPVMLFFGLPPRTSFLWIVANTLGLAYGAAIMIEESKSGKINNRDVNLLNTHISISHSNIEDLILLAALGGVWYVLLLSRWAASFVLVWELRLEYYIKDKFIQKKY